MEVHKLNRRLSHLESKLGSGGNSSGFCILYMRISWLFLTMLGTIKQALRLVKKVAKLQIIIRCFVSSFIDRHVLSKSAKKVILVHHCPLFSSSKAKRHSHERVPGR
jgi:hypothetical protein